MQDQDKEPIKFENLPQDIQTAITDAGLTEKIRGIGKRYSLHIDQVGDLEEEVTLVMFGVIDPKGFVQEIASRLEIGEDTATKIVNDVNNEVFVAIKESLRKIYAGNDSVESEEDQTALKKADVLREIEEPTPVLSKMVTYQTESVEGENKAEEERGSTHAVSTPAPLAEFKPPQESSQAEASPTASFPNSSFADTKLNEVVISPKKEVELPSTLSSPQASSENKYTNVDPYRESAN